MNIYDRNPCKPDCENRSSTCHGECTKYKEWRGSLDEYNKRKSLENEKYTMSEPKRKWLRKQQRKNGRKNPVKI